MIADPHYLLLLPDVTAAGTPRLHVIWSGDLGLGLSQTLNGGYSPFRLLVRAWSITPGSAVPTSRKGGAFSVLKGEFVLLRRAGPRPWTHHEARVIVVGVEASLDLAKKRATARRSETLIAKVVAIGNANGGGELPGLAWDGREAQFPRAPSR